MNCKPGDVAIVIFAHTPSNVGTIVQVINGYEGDIPLSWDGQTWLVRASVLMKWFVGEQPVMRMAGPVPDAYLKPIRGREPTTDDQALVISDAAR
jgi:hypothetical protein